MITTYDVYFVKDTGVPLVSGCTMTDYCRAHMQQHELQAGFLAALSSFAEEAFDEEQLKTIEFGEIQINMMKKRETIFAIVNSIDSNKETIRERLTLTIEKFINKYDQYLDDPYTDLQIFNGTREILIQTGLVVDNLNNSEEFQRAENSKKAKFLNWIKSIIPS